ncbi:MAG: hypothetical protein RLZZ401_102, partial [Pseudomonadota bacterium]
NNSFGFGKFVPGFDFLQGLASTAVQGASKSMPQLPKLGNWVAPTLNVEELDKRIEELKAVQFWLDQNALALKATIQALEVQKMTLATLKGMNFNMGDIANAFKIKATETVASTVQKVNEKAASMAPPMAAEPDKPSARATSKPTKAAEAAPGVVDPLQWWGALTQQFQQIAAGAMKDAAKQTALDTTRNMATGLAKEAIKTATGMARSAASSVKPKPARKAARKTSR